MKTILVLTDFSERANHAAAYAWQLAEQTGARLLFFNAYYVPQTITMDSGLYPLYYDDLSSFEKSSMERLSKLAADLAWQFHPEADNDRPEYECRTAMGPLADALSKLLDSVPVWMIVMGSKDQDDHLSHVLVGSDANQVVSCATCPVLVVPAAVSFRRFERMGFALAAFGPRELTALEFFKALAGKFGAEIVAAHVLPQEKTGEDSDDFVEEMALFASDLHYPRLRFLPVHEDEVAHALSDIMHREGLDMMALVHKKYPFFKQMFHKSITRKMMQDHALPLLVFPANFVDSRQVFFARR